MSQKVPHHGESDLPADLAEPARRALQQAGYLRLEQLADVAEDEIRQLHGIGPKSLQQLNEAMAAKGLSFLDRP
jgi:hypothetical protein